MTRRAYISCPLEAALAYKDLGMRFVDENGEEIHIKSLANGAYWQKGYAAGDHIGNHYIDDESLPLLEPQELDEWRVGDWIYWIKSEGDSDNYEGQQVMTIHEIRQAIADGYKQCSLVARDDINFPAIQYEDVV